MATATPTPTPVTVSAEQASSAGTLNPAPVFIIGGIMLAATLAFLSRPVRAVAVRLIAWKGAR